MSAVQELFAYFCWIMLLSGLPLLLLACSGKRMAVSEWLRRREKIRSRYTSMIQKTC